MPRPTAPPGARLLDQAAALVASVPPARADAPWLGPGTDRLRGIGSFLDHTLLKPEATGGQIDALTDEGVRLGVAAVCVNGCWVARCAERVAGSGVLVAAVVGFPLGAMATAIKEQEARQVVGDGAGEVDMVLALGEAKSGEWDRVRDDIRLVVEAAGSARVKVILETGALEPVEIAAACLVAQAAGAAFVKTSTGFHPSGGATLEAVALMRYAVGDHMGVKASGGVRTAEAAIAMLRAGANRIGTSATVAMSSVIGAGAPAVGELLRGVSRPG